MRPDPLQPGPGDLERELAGRICPEPPVDLRDRILAAVSAQQSRPPRIWPVWQVAAAVVLIVNLAMSASTAIRYQSLHSRDASSAGFARGSGKAPADADERFRAFATSTLAQLTPAPDVGLAARRFFKQEEN